MKLYFLFVTYFLFNCSNLIHAVIINDSIPSGKNFDKAIFRLWFSDNNNTIKGIIILTAGYNGDDRESVKDTLWRKLAQKYNFALLACYYTDYARAGIDNERYCNVKEGSGQALLDVINHFSLKSGHKELLNAPLLFWGLSAGGQFNYEFVCWKPERVIAFVVNKGGYYYTAFATKKTRDVPGIFFIGEKDSESRKDIVKGIFSMNRKMGALWTFAEEPGIGHELGQTKKLAFNYFNEIIPIRISKSSNTDSLELLQKIPVNYGFIGDLKNQNYQSCSNVQQSDTITAWLPSSTFANDWIAFIKNEPFKTKELTTTINAR